MAASRRASGEGSLGETSGGELSHAAPDAGLDDEGPHARGPDPKVRERAIYINTQRLHRYTNVPKLDALHGGLFTGYESEGKLQLEK